MRRGLPFVLLTVLIVPAAASARQGPPFPDAAREWLSRDLPFRFRAMIALGDSLFNNGSCTRCHGDDATGTRRAPDLTDAEWVQSEGDLEGIFQVIFWGVRRRD
ncbi:MAG: c-type cytochrome, partial [Gammaproteobacteria bacterium]